MTNTPAQKAFAILKKNMDIYEMKVLIALLEEHIEIEVQKGMAEQL